jgi:hypothetical protein
LAPRTVRKFTWSVAIRTNNARGFVGNVLWHKAILEAGLEDGLPGTGSVGRFGVKPEVAPAARQEIADISLRAKRSNCIVRPRDETAVCPGRMALKETDVLAEPM